MCMNACLCVCVFLHSVFASLRWSSLLISSQSAKMGSRTETVPKIFLQRTSALERKVFSQCTSNMCFLPIVAQRPLSPLHLSVHPFGKSRPASPSPGHFSTSKAHGGLTSRKSQRNNPGTFSGLDHRQTRRVPCFIQDLPHDLCTVAVT